MSGRISEGLPLACRRAQPPTGPLAGIVSVGKSPITRRMFPKKTPHARDRAQQGSAVQPYLQDHRVKEPLPDPCRAGIRGAGERPQEIPEPAAQVRPDPVSSEWMPELRDASMARGPVT